MNSAQPPEDGPWDATRGPHQQARDPGREEGWGPIFEVVAELSLAVLVKYITLSSR